MITSPKSSHTWLKNVKLAYLPGPTTSLLDEFCTGLLHSFVDQGHTVFSAQALSTPPSAGGGEELKLDVLLTTAPFGQPINWREAYLFTARKKFNLAGAPAVFTILHARPAQFTQLLQHLQAALGKREPDPADFDFPGLAPTAYRTLFEQGCRAGPLMAAIRLLQSQSKCIRLILVIGDERPSEAYLFDLVGAHPRVDARDTQAFYQDIYYRILTAVSTYEITDHQEAGEPISQATWQALSAPAAMRRAGRELGRRHFFTEMVRVADLATVPALHEAVSSQYSEGCFATWEPGLQALIATITGSARPVDKGQLGDDELAVIVGARPDGSGALVRRVEGKRNDPPSSEAVEMILVDQVLPRLALGTAQVPIVRSKLHGHRGVKAYDPGLVEHVYLDRPFYDYPVSCSTAAQAGAIRAAFARSAALKDPNDPRLVIFTILPGHGVFIAEKWLPDKQPFQIIWELIDAGVLEIDPLVPQGVLAYLPDETGKMILVE